MNKTLDVTGMQPDWEKISALVDDGYIRVQTHPEDPSLEIYCYTPKTQYEQHWTPETLMCRGLIARNNEVIARPFQKFFNWQELEGSDLLKGPWHVYEKMDGSLGILYQFAEGDWRIATKGSFDSEQSIKANEILKNKYANFKPDKGITYLFEIIYPENRIVVDYKNYEDIILIDTLDTVTGKSVEANKEGLPQVTYHGLKQGIPNEEVVNSEGYVLKNAADFRVKVKWSEYVRLHKILTGMSSTMIWEYLRDDRDFDEILNNVPDEFYNWVAKTQGELEKQYIEQYRLVLEVYKDRANHVENTQDRKELWQYFERFPDLKHWLISLHKLENGIWDSIKPERELPFRQENEDA